MCVLTEPIDDCAAAVHVTLQECGCTCLGMSSLTLVSWIMFVFYTQIRLSYLQSTPVVVSCPKPFIECVEHRCTHTIKC